MNCGINKLSDQMCLMYIIIYRTEFNVKLSYVIWGHVMNSVKQLKKERQRHDS